MSYTGPGSVVTVADEFLAHWLTVNNALTPVPLTVVLEGTEVVKTRNDLQTLRTRYQAVQSQASGTVVLPLPAPQSLSVQALRNTEENARRAGETARRLVVEAIGAFNRKVRGSLAHTTFPNALPAVPGVTDGNAVILAAGDDMLSVWATVNSSPAGPLFTPPLVATIMPAGTNTPAALPLADATTRLAALRTAVQDLLTAENGLQAMRPYRDNLWENEIRPLIVAYQNKVRGEFPAEHALVASLPRIYPEGGHTPDPVNATGVWNAVTGLADYTWSASSEPMLLRYEVRQSPGPTYEADASSVIASIPAGGVLSFSTDAGLTVPGQTSSVKIFVILTTDNERGSNTVTVTRPA